MTNPWLSPETVADEMGLLLPQMALLFDSPRGKKLPNGNVDLGFNCCAKAFVAMYLARLRGLAVDICRGETLLVEKSSGLYYSYRINPHVWVGAADVKVIDLSIRDFQKRKFLPIVAGTSYDWKQWDVTVTVDRADYQEFGTNCARLPDGAHVRYWMQEIRVFDFAELNLSDMAVASESTRRIAARYPGNNVVAKAILHLHRLVSGTRLPLVAEIQKIAWDELARWQVDAVGELRSMLQDAGTLHATADWEQDGLLLGTPKSAAAWEAPAPPCCLAG